jgi:iron complex outermembrane recepter protein
MHQFKKTVLAVSILAVVPTFAHAQLEEVLVTATKRVESLQDIPMSISAVSGESIERLGAADFNDIATTVPSLSLRSSGPGRTKLNIRGISAATGVAPTVSFYIDEMPISTISSGSSTSFAQTIIDPKLYDLERVEVLRGPQGTLYGSSSMGGTVRLITGQPLIGESEGSVNAELSDTKDGDLNYKLNGMYNLPTGDNSALRMVGSYTDRSGFIDRVDRETGETFDDEVNTEESLALRAAWRMEIAEGAGFIQPFIFYQKNEMDGKPSYDGPFNEFEQVRQFDAAEPFEDEFTMANLTYSQDFSSVSLVASLSQLDREFSNLEDLTDQTFNAVGEGPTAVISEEDVELDDLTFESRLASNGDSALSWMVGVFYKDAEADSGYRMQRGFDPALSLFGLANTQDTKNYEEYAGFGELTYDFGERFTLTVGARYLDYTFEQYKEDWGFVYAADSGGTDRDEANILDLEVKDDDVHGKVVGTFHLTDAAQIYGMMSNGSRPGGGNRAVPRSTNPASTTAFACDQDLQRLGISGSPDSYAGDEVINTELGWKTDIGDRVRLNGAVYQIDWEDIQQVVNTSGDCGFNFTTNAGDARSRGVELEVAAAITDNFGLNFNVGYIDAEFKDDVPGTNIKSGDYLADVPEWTYNLSLDYVIPTNSGEFFAVFSYNYVDEQQELAGQPDDDLTEGGIISGNIKPDYEILDLRIGFSSENNWETVVFVDNMTDEEAIYTYSDVLAFNITDYDRTVRNRPRTYGVSVSYNF